MALFILVLVSISILKRCLFTCKNEREVLNTRTKCYETYY